MEKSRIAQFTAYFQSDSTAVWNAMTDHTDFSWRSDLTRINTVNDREFIEIFKNGNETRFLITEKEPCREICISYGAYIIYRRVVGSVYRFAG